MPTDVSRARVVDLNDAPIRPERAYVLLWVTAHRRVGDCFTTDHAVNLANELGKPLVVFEALRVGYPHASVRLHRFVLDGMADVVEQVTAAGVTSFAYVERRRGEASGSLEALAREACVVVTDDHPGFFFPRLVRAAAGAIDVRLVGVDSNGLLPLRLVPDLHASAYSYRRAMQKLIAPQLAMVPSREPLRALAVRSEAAIDPAVRARWPSLDAGRLRDPSLLASLPVDRGVPLVGTMRGGPRAAEATLERFVTTRLARYTDRSHPDVEATSGLSPYLHFGHLGVHRIVDAVAPGLVHHRLVPNGGKREGFFGLDPAREAFLDQLLTWRELGFSLAAKEPRYERYESLPAWARATLDAHRRDPRVERYDRGTLERAATSDPVWNAAQRELLETGTMHNFMRMLWGKKVLAWSESPEVAFETLAYLNDRWAIDGRDPNSYNGIGWVFGRFDRPWGPERPIFGTVRYMTSANTVRKLELDEYLARFGEGGTRP